MINFIDLQEFFTFYFLTSVFDKQSVLAFHEKFCFLPFWKREIVKKRLFHKIFVLYGCIFVRKKHILLHAVAYANTVFKEANPNFKQ